MILYLCSVCYPPICVRWPGLVRGWCRLRVVEGPRADKLLLSRRGGSESGQSGGNCQQQATTTCRHQPRAASSDRRGRHPNTNTVTLQFLARLGIYVTYDFI